MRTRYDERAELNAVRPEVPSSAPVRPFPGTGLRLPANGSSEAVQTYRLLKHGLY